jgi:hypothetical protein
MIDYNYTIKKKLEGGKMSELNFMYWIKVFYNNGVGISGAHSIEDAERRFNIDIRRSKYPDRKVVLRKDGTIFTGKSRSQAEVALNYLKTNYPSYTNFRIGGTGEWDNPYFATMEKTLKVYDVFDKKISILGEDDEK